MSTSHTVGRILRELDECGREGLLQLQWLCIRTVSTSSTLVHCSVSDAYRKLVTCAGVDTGMTRGRGSIDRARQ